MSEHPCPVNGCSKQVPFEILMCKTHWYMVPPGLRNQVNEKWRNNSPNYGAVRQQAIDAVNSYLERYA